MAKKGITIGETKTPGKKLTDLGLGIAIMGVIITVIVLMQGGSVAAAWLIAIGLVVVAIGFAQRMLAAVERR